MRTYKAILFDLDGTLVQTERLKAISYAQAAVELTPQAVQEEAVIDAFKEVVGRSRHEVARYLLDRFNLAEDASQRMAEFSVDTPMDAFIQIRLQFYERMISDPLVIQKSIWPHNLAQLQHAIDDGYQTGLATMSHREQASRILEILNLTDSFDVIATRDDVEKGKPDPEIYHLVTLALQVEPEQCLVFEDSVSGVKAALAAGMTVIAVSTPFTKNTLIHENLLPEDQLVHDPQKLPDIVDRLLSREHSKLAT